MGGLRLSLRPTIRLKLLAGSLVMVLLTTGIAKLAINRLGRVNERAQDAQRHAVIPSVAALRAARATDGLQRGLLQVRLLGPRATPAQLKPLGDEAVALIASLQSELKTLNATAPPVTAASLRALNANSKAFLTLLAKASKAPPATQSPQQQDAVYAQFATINDNLSAAAERTSNLLNRDVEHANDQIRSAYASAKRAILIALALTILVGLGSSLLVSEGIRRGVRRIIHRLRRLTETDTVALRDGLRAVAAGDLTQRVTTVTEPIEHPGGDEIGDVARMVNAIRDTTLSSVDAYHTSLDGLSELIGEVSRNAARLSTASAEVATTSRETGRAVSEVANAMSDVAGGAERQVQTVAWPGR